MKSQNSQRGAVKTDVVEQLQDGTEDPLSNAEDIRPESADSKKTVERGEDGKPGTQVDPDSRTRERDE